MPSAARHSSSVLHTLLYIHIYTCTRPLDTCGFCRSSVNIQGSGRWTFSRFLCIYIYIYIRQAAAVLSASAFNARFRILYSTGAKFVQTRPPLHRVYRATSSFSPLSFIRSIFHSSCTSPRVISRGYTPACII